MTPASFAGRSHGNSSATFRTGGTVDEIYDEEDGRNGQDNQNDGPKQDVAGETF
jgi:hypothetical protein